MTEYKEPFREFTHEEWLAEGKRLFGEGQENWRFKCFSCGMELSVLEAKARFPELKGCGWKTGQECIGRYTDKVDCDWAAYGLFRGPWFVKMDDGEEIAVFEFGEPIDRSSKSP